MLNILYALFFSNIEKIHDLIQPRMSELGLKHDVQIMDFDDELTATIRIGENLYDRAMVDGYFWGD